MTMILIMECIAQKNRPHRARKILLALLKKYTHRKDYFRAGRYPLLLQFVETFRQLPAVGDAIQLRADGVAQSGEAVVGVRVGLEQ